MLKNSDSVSITLDGPCFIGMLMTYRGELLLMNYSLWRRVFLVIKYDDSSQFVAGSGV